MEHISLDYYRVFYQVAECGSITCAAQQLYLVQSSVSRTITNLEKALGCTLLYRTHQGTMLTPEGEMLYRHLKSAFAHIETAEEKLHSIAGVNEGTISVGVSELSMQFYLLKAVERFHREHPNVLMRFSFSNPSLAAQDLENGLLDLAVLASPIAESGAMRVRRLVPIEYIIVAGRGFPELGNRMVEAAELGRYPIISMEAGTSVRRYLDRLASAAGISIQPECEVGSIPFLLSMVQQNMGLGLLPAAHAREALKSGTVFEVKIDRKLPVESLCLLTNVNAPMNCAAARFAEMLPSCCKEEGGRQKACQRARA